jgi:uncharacterized protein
LEAHRAHFPFSIAPKIPTLPGVEFEFDPAKSAVNKAKHGVDFDHARLIWEDPDRLEAPARITEGEERYLMIGRIEERIWTAVFTLRAGRIRLISARRAHKNEEEYYAGKNPLI